MPSLLPSLIRDILRHRARAEPQGAGYRCVAEGAARGLTVDREIELWSALAALVGLFVGFLIGGQYMLWSTHKHFTQALDIMASIKVEDEKET